MRKIKAIALGIFLAPTFAFAHHSTYEFDTDVITELTGELIRVTWRNPHVRMQLRVINENGEEEIWEMEGHDVNSLDRSSVSRDLVQPGQVVRVAGSPSTRRTALLVTNVLLADGREVLTHLTGVPRWRPRAACRKDFQRDGYIHGPVGRGRVIDRDLARVRTRD